MTLVTPVEPEETCVLAIAVRVTDVDPRGVRAHHQRSQHLSHQHLIQGSQQLGTGQPPIAGSRPRERESVTPGDPLLAVQRQMIGGLADDDVRQQARPRAAARNGQRRFFGHDHVFLLASRTAFRQLRSPRVFLLDATHDVQATRVPLVMLADFFSDVDELPVANQRRLLGLRKIVDLFANFDVVGPAAAAVAFPFALGRRVVGRLLGRTFGRHRFHRCVARGCLFCGGIEQGALPRVDLLAAASVEPPQQEIHAMLERLSLVGFGAQLLDQLNHELLQQREIVRQRIRIGQRQSVLAHHPGSDSPRKKVTQKTIRFLYERPAQQEHSIVGGRSLRERGLLSSFLSSNAQRIQELQSALGGVGGREHREHPTRSAPLRREVATAIGMRSDSGFREQPGLNGRPWPFRPEPGVDSVCRGARWRDRRHRATWPNRRRRW